MQNLQPYLELDIEYGNSDSFYSGFKSKTLPYAFPVYTSDDLDCNNYEFNWRGKLSKTDLALKEKWNVISDDKFLRRVVFLPEKNSSLFDMVSRFVIYSDCPDSATISNQHYSHKSSNLYYQFENYGEVEIPVSKNKKLTFYSGQVQVPKGFKEVFYIRDEAKTKCGYRWIVHHRLIVDPKQCTLVLRCCNPRFEGAVPQQNLIPKWFKRIFFRIREARYPNFPFMTVGERILQRNENAMIETIVEINDR